MEISNVLKKRDALRFSGLSRATGFKSVIEAHKLDQEIKSRALEESSERNGWKVRRAQAQVFEFLAGSSLSQDEISQRLALADAEIYAETVEQPARELKQAQEREFYEKTARQRVACQRDNISTELAEKEIQAGEKTRKKSNNTGYRRKRAFEVETNVLKSAEYHGLAYCLEFTVTIKAVGVELTSKSFSQAWNYFNSKYFSCSSWVKSWVMVKEVTKAGEIHAHLFVLTKKPVFQVALTGEKDALELKRFCPKFKKWVSEFWKEPKYYYRNSKTGKRYKNKESIPADEMTRLTVDGKSIASWIPAEWEKFRAGDLEKYGLGVSHSLQPIKGLTAQSGEQTAVNYAKYMSKYLTKGFAEDRPEHLKNVRLVNYSQNFNRYCRAIHIDRKAEFWNGFDSANPYEREGLREEVRKTGLTFGKRKFYHALKIDLQGIEELLQFKILFKPKPLELLHKDFELETSVFSWLGPALKKLEFIFNFESKIEYLSGIKTKQVFTCVDEETGEKFDFVDYEALEVKERFNCVGAFSFYSPSANLQRKRRAETAQLIGINSLDEARQAFGSKWAYKLKDASALCPVSFEAQKDTFIAHSIARGIEENSSFNAVFTYQKDENGKIYRYSARQLDRIDALMYQHNETGRICVKLEGWKDRFTGAEIKPREIWEATRFEFDYQIASLRRALGKNNFFNN